MRRLYFFFDDICNKGCGEDDRKLTVDQRGCNFFVRGYINDVEMILKRLKEVDLTLSIDKSKFEVDEVLASGHL